MFEELNGCFGAAYWVNNGTVMKKLELRTNGISPRCGYTAVTVDWYQQTYVNGTAYGDPTYLGTGTNYVYQGCLEIASGTSSYDATMATSQSVSGSPAGDAYYSDYLAPLETITVRRRLCSTSFTFRTVVDPNAINPQTFLEAGLRNDGIRFWDPTSSSGISSVGITYVSFALPLFSPNYQQGLTSGQAATMTTNAINLAVTQVQQQIFTGQITNLREDFWQAVDRNIQTNLGEPGIKSYITRSSAPKVYVNPANNNPTTSIVYIIPTTDNNCN